MTVHRILRIAQALDANELLIVTKEVSEGLRKRVIQRPDAFCKLASLDDALGRLLENLDEEKP